MPLPTAVKRNAEKARQSMAAPQAPPQSDDEYLQPFDPSSSDKHVASTEQREGQYVPHSLSDDVASTKLSATDPAGGAQVNENRSAQSFIDPEDWKARYAALRASRDERSSSLEREMTELRAQNRSLTEKLNQVTQVDQAAERKQFDEQATKAFGEDGAQLFNQINSRIDSQMQAQQASSISAFESNMDSLVPGWRQINVEPGFLQYLSGVDDVMGISRQAMLDRIVDGRDAESAAAMFRNYVATSSAQTQQRNGSQVPELATQRSGALLGAEESLVEEWSESEIADFYQAKSRMYQSGQLNDPSKLAKVQADEARIRSAMAEGRVYKG